MIGQSSSADARAAVQPPITIVVADDHPIVRAGIIHELSYHPDLSVVGEAASGLQAIEQVQALVPDVLMLDISMPGLSAVDVLRRVQLLPNPPYVLAVTAHNDLNTILSMLKAGATGYLLKDEDSSVIATAVRSVARGERWMSAPVTTLVVNHAVYDPAVPSEDVLSEREIEVLRQLVEGQDNQEIGAALHISERTVRFHLRNIYDKLGVRRGGAIAWGIRHGLLAGERQV